MRNLRRVLNLKERNASCVYVYINTYAPISKEALLLFLREQLKTSRLFLNSIPSPLLGEFLSYFFPSFSFFFYKGSKSVPKAPPRWSFIERDPLTFHYSKSRLRSSKDKNEISVVVAEQHFNLAYVLSNPIYINPLVLSISPRRNFSRSPFSHPSFPIPRRFIHFKRGRGKRNSAKCCELSIIYKKKNS